MCVYVTEKCELIIGVCMCHRFTQRGDLFHYMWIFKYRCVACSWKGDFNVAHTRYSGFCHCRVSLCWRAGFCWTTWSPEDRTSLEDAASCTCPNLCKNDVHVCTVCVTGNVVGWVTDSLKSKLFYCMWICIYMYVILYCCILFEWNCVEGRLFYWRKGQ